MKLYLIAAVLAICVYGSWAGYNDCDPKCCEWDDWTTWSECENNMRYSTRECKHKYYPIPKKCRPYKCYGKERKTEYCREDCGGCCKWSSWGTWSECKNNMRKRTRECTKPSYCDDYCSGTEEQTERCGYGECEHECCEWGTWSDWSDCEDYKETRYRECRRKSYCKYAYPDCDGREEEERDCKPKKDCDECCNWTKWKGKKCGDDCYMKQKRKYKCKKSYDCPPPKECKKKKQTRKAYCCEWSKWSECEGKKNAYGKYEYCKRYRECEHDCVPNQANTNCIDCSDNPKVYEDCDYKDCY